MADTTSINSSLAIQQSYSANSGRTNGLLQKINLLENQLKQVEKNDDLTDKEKQQKEQALQNQIDNLTKQVSSEQKKEEQKRQVQQAQQERRRLENTMDPETAELALSIEQMLKTALQADAQELPSDITDDLELEELDQVNNETQPQVNSENIVADTDSSTGEELSPMQQLEGYIEELKEDKQTGKQFDKLPKGMIVDEFL